MIKKILLLAAALATSSFATWDFFGIPQNSPGSVKAGLYYDMDDDWSQMGFTVGGRINITPKFELSIQSFGFQFWGESECDEDTPTCNGYEDGGYGLRDMIIGGRFALTPMLNLFLDLNLPIGRDKNDGSGTTPPSHHELFLYFGGQFHNDINSLKGASFGTEAGIFWGFEHHNLERGLEVHLGGEFDYTLPAAPITLVVGGQIWLRLFKSEYDNGNKDVDLHDNWSQQYKIWVGANFGVTDKLSINGRIIARSQDLKHRAKDGGRKIDMEGDATGFAVDVEFKF